MVFKELKKKKKKHERDKSRENVASMWFTVTINKRLLEGVIVRFSFFRENIWHDGFWFYFLSCDLNILFLCLYLKNRSATQILYSVGFHMPNSLIWLKINKVPWFGGETPLSPRILTHLAPLSSSFSHLSIFFWPLLLVWSPLFICLFVLFLSFSFFFFLLFSLPVCVPRQPIE